MLRKPYLYATILLCIALRVAAQTAPDTAAQSPAEFVLTIPFASTTAPTSWIPLDVKVNGKGPYLFVLDTGADYNSVSLDLAAELGLKPDRTIQIYSGGKKFVNGGLVGL